MRGEQVTANPLETPQLQPITLDDLQGLGELLIVFLDAMRRRLPPSGEHQAGLERLERLSQRLSPEGKSAVLMDDDLLLLEETLLLLAMFLLLEVPRSQRRDIALEGLWKMKGRLSEQKCLRAPGWN